MDMLTDKKLQVYLPKSLATRVSRKAREDGKTIAQVVRESLEAFLNRPLSERTREAFSSLDHLVGAFRDDGSGVAERHDEFLGSTRW